MNKNIELENIDPVIFDRLKFEADKQGSDLKTFVIDLIKKSLGLSNISDKEIQYNDLNSLAGTWSQKEYDTFNNNTAEFNQISKDLWK